MNNICSFYIITDGNLGIQCTKILLEARHRVLGIISGVPEVRDWAYKHNIPNFSSLKQFEQIDPNKTFDYLLSIINTQILSPRLLSYPRFYGINYHDAFLPKYAGSNATSWAILNNEKTHGVTWHVMNTLIDAGDIIKQVTFPIATDETALTLNLKCYTHAIESFKLLIKDLAQGSLHRNPQNDAERSYYGVHKKPQNVGLIDWQTSAQEIGRLYRALCFGDYPNTLATFKVLIGKEIFFPHHFEALKEKTGTEPGKIAKILAHGLQITTQTEDIIIGNFTDVQGNECSSHELSFTLNFREGYKLPVCNQQTKSKLQQLATLLSPYENYWVKKLQQIPSAKLPFSDSKNHILIHKQTFKRPNHDFFITVDIDKILIKNASEQFAGFSFVDFLTCAFMIYFSRLNDKNIFKIDYTNPSIKKDTVPLTPFLTSAVPLILDILPTLTVKEIIQLFIDEKIKIENNKTYFLDVKERYPTLRSLSFSSSDIKIDVISSKNKILSICSSYQLIICIDQQKNNYSLVVSKNLTEAEKNFIKNIPLHIEFLLENIIKNPSQAIGALPFLTSQEEHQILIEWNNTKIDYPVNKSISQLFEEQVERTPDNIAVVYEEQGLTYQELNNKTNQLSYYLRSLGIGPDTLVAIAVEDPLEMIIGLIGILKAGGAYVPLDPDYPQERLQFILEDTNVPIVLTDSKTIDKLPVTFARFICLDKERDLISTFSSANPAPCIIPHHLAYVIYTSGSTGKPKGVLITHGSLFNLLLSMKQITLLLPGQYFLQNVSFSFDPSLWTTLWPLIQGASLLLMARQKIHDPTFLMEYIQKYSLSIFHAGPSLLRVLLSQKEMQGNKTLNHIIGGGEKWLDEDLRAAKEILPHCKLTNVYGPTEATIHVLTGSCKEELTDSIPIGRPISNTQIYILDSYRNPVPVGVSGEIYIGGEGLARGYLNRPDLTAEKFVPNPFIQEEDLLQAKNLRLYRTGDLARYLTDGNIEFIGRSDDQVKIRGFRIELGEIEANLLQYPDVSQVVVIVREDQPELKQLVAYVVPKTEILTAFERETVLSASNQENFTILKGKEVSSLTEDLRIHLSQFLPDYMLPAFFVFINKLPLNPNGKIDRRSLPTPEITNIEGYVAPRNELETKICRVWSELLGIPENKIGIHDDFFKLGGNSLLAIRLANKLNTVIFPYKFSIAVLFKCPKINDFVHHILSNVQNEGVEYEL